MLVPHDSFILVADGQTMLFFRNDGDTEYLNLTVEDKDVQDNPPDREQKTDAAGAHMGSTGVSTDSFGETDYHQLEESRFAAQAAEMLKRRALNNEFENLIIVAPARTLGELRKHYHKEVEKRISREIAKDLTSHPVSEIEKILISE